MTKCYYLKMAETVFKVETPYDLSIEDSFIPFMLRMDQCDISIDYSFGFPSVEEEKQLEIKNPLVWRGNNYYRIERRLMSSKPSGGIVLRDNQPFHVEGYLYSNAKQTIKTMSDLLDISELEILFANRDSFFLHSSVVSRRKSAILFTAPSGTGKTTQAELWEKHRLSHQINGDRALIRKTEKGWMAFGSPYAGTSKIYRNESAPIEAIVVIRQNPENRIKRLTPMESFRYLYSETVIPKWNPNVHKHMMDLIDNISREIPVVMFHCTPDSRAVDVLEHYLQEEMI